LERGLAIKEAAYGPEHPQVARTLNNLGDARRGVGDLAGAVKLFERALAIKEAAYGPEHRL
jgi:Tfp pilus assembly protein PilF